MIKQEENLMDKDYLKAPFTYFGGKRRVAHIVWQALGDDVGHYMEPFCGSCAVLLKRENYDPKKHVETIVDKDGFICNVWRALQHSPDEVAKYCDWPVNHADLSARRLSLIANEQRLLDNLIADPEWYDAKMAGYWIWAASCWIGPGLTNISQRPDLGEGKGVHKLSKIPQLTGGTGVHKISGIPHLGKGMGVHRIGIRSEIDDTILDVREPYNTNIYKWFRVLSERLRYVRVVCGDWKRVCGGNWQDKVQGTVGIFFDPPYSVENRYKAIYHHDDLSVSKEVAKWSLERGKKETYRIVLAGYFEEHERLLEHGWSVYKWKAQGGYANVGKGKTQGKINRHREALFMSPHCLKISE